MALSENSVGTDLPVVTYRWEPTDAIVYALGVGARPPADLGYLNEAHGPAVLPTLALVANWWAVKDLRAALDMGSVPIVHSAQSLTLHRPMAPQGEVRVAAAVSAVWDTGKHAIVEVTSRGHDDGGELFCARSQTMALGGGGFGGARGPAPDPEPDTPPDASVDDDVRPEQAAIYRLSGDRNQLHIDPDAARRYGFDDVFLHGLCTLGFAARALIRTVGRGEPERLAELSCRFAKPVGLGAPLTTDIWHDGQNARFRSRQGQTVALSAGSARFSTEGD
ncbi:MaoC/PaaZ C-terminal domain-containing protein [Mycolicibacterium sp. 018/SC-01/001]|uniref:MaoC/PaaZ C-terminal domain-containing protein n=1 Tax=Mycolicibacterium sp. 018/SC-01/001 TaxID=2592069 RepID=UPI00163DD19A|nr:MaoC/PaaZ C-terminal domain-containing protein [Mycolicibacterium sp. 018/SC-01/001]